MRKRGDTNAKAAEVDWHNNAFLMKSRPLKELALWEVLSVAKE